MFREVQYERYVRFPITNKTGKLSNFERHCGTGNEISFWHRGVL